MDTVMISIDLDELELLRVAPQRRSAIGGARFATSGGGLCGQAGFIGRRAIQTSRGQGDVFERPYAAFGLFRPDLAWTVLLD